MFFRRSFHYNIGFMFSKACEYGIRSVIFIKAKSVNGERVGIKDIFKEVGAPEHFTAKILQNLSKKGIIRSAKGPYGGFYIEKDRDIKLIEIVKVIDGDAVFKGCGLGLHECSELKPCPIHHEFKVIREQLRSMLENTTVQQLTEGLGKGLVFLKK